MWATKPKPIAVKTELEIIWVVPAVHVDPAFISRISSVEGFLRVDAAKCIFLRPAGGFSPARCNILPAWGLYILQTSAGLVRVLIQRHPPPYIIRVGQKDYTYRSLLCFIYIHYSSTQDSLKGRFRLKVTMLLYRRRLFLIAHTLVALVKRHNSGCFCGGRTPSVLL